MAPSASPATFVAFEEWTGSRDVPTLGTNAGATVLPFQGWRRFKEAFAPELVRLAIAEAGDVERVIDPFGGSGTTALAAQFLGVRPTTIEVNPFLADLIEAKICRYDMDQLVKGYVQVAEVAHGLREPAQLAAVDRAVVGARKVPRLVVSPNGSGREVAHAAQQAREAVYRDAAADLRAWTRSVQSRPDVVPQVSVLGIAEAGFRSIGGFSERAG